MGFDSKNCERVSACTPIIITDSSYNERFKVGRPAEELWDVFGKGKTVKITQISKSSNRVHVEEVVREKQSCIITALKIVGFVALFPFIAITRMIYRGLNKFYLTPLKIQRNTTPTLVADPKPADKPADQIKPTDSNAAPTPSAKPVTPAAKPADPTKPAAELAKPVTATADAKPAEEPAKPEVPPQPVATSQEVPVSNEEPSQPAINSSVPATTEATGAPKLTEDKNGTSSQASQDETSEVEASNGKPQAEEPAPAHAPKPEEKPPVVVAEPAPAPTQPQPIINEPSKLAEKDAADAQSNKGSEADASASQGQQEKPAADVAPTPSAAKVPNPAPAKAKNPLAAPGKTPMPKKLGNQFPAQGKWAKRPVSDPKISDPTPAETTPVNSAQPVQTGPQPLPPFGFQDPSLANKPDVPVQEPKAPETVLILQPIPVEGAQFITFSLEAQEAQQRATSPNPDEDDVEKVEVNEFDHLIEEIQTNITTKPHQDAPKIADKPAGSRDSLDILMEELAASKLVPESNSATQATKVDIIAAQSLPQASAPDEVELPVSPRVQEQAQEAQVVAARLQMPKPAEYKSWNAQKLAYEIKRLAEDTLQLQLVNKNKLDDAAKEQLVLANNELILEYAAHFLKYSRDNKEFNNAKDNVFKAINSSFEGVHGKAILDELLKNHAAVKKTDAKAVLQAKTLVTYYKEHRRETDSAKVVAKLNAKLGKITLSEPKYTLKKSQPLVGSENQTKLNDIEIVDEKTKYSTVGISTTTGRKDMEDYYIQQMISLGNVRVSLSGVFDGHSEDGKGSKCAEFLKDNIGVFLAKAFEGKTSLDALTVKNGVTEAFVKLNEAWHIEKAKNPKAKSSGSTACISLAFIDPGSNKPVVYVANTGDSRAVLVHDQGVIQLSTDASYRDETADPAESLNKKFQNGIAARGGDLTELAKKKSLGGVTPIRSFGHSDIRGITVRPEISRFYPMDYKKSRLVLFTDGTGDVIGSNELPELAKNQDGNLSMVDFANRIVRESASRWAAVKKSDNNTVIAIELS